MRRRNSSGPPRANVEAARSELNLRILLLCSVVEAVLKYTPQSLL